VFKSAQLASEQAPQTARIDLPIIHDTFRKNQDVKLSSCTAIVASASYCGPRVTL